MVFLPNFAINSSLWVFSFFSLRSPRPLAVNYYACFIRIKITLKMHLATDIHELTRNRNF